MKTKIYFEWTRFYSLLRLENRRNRKGILLTLAIILGFMYFIGLILSPVMDPAMSVFEHYSGYAFSLLIGGFVLSSLAFRDHGNPLKRYNYLMLPASSFEKFLSMWVLTSPGWILGYTLIYTLYTILANLTGRLLFDHLVFLPFNPLAVQALKFVNLYFILQGIFLAGASHFRGYPFPKTLLTLVLTGVGIGLSAWLITKGVYDEEFMSDPQIFSEMKIAGVWAFLQFLFQWVLAPLSWIIAYYGIKEQEV